MPAEDLYALLQVHPSAEPDVIRAAYHVLTVNHRLDDGSDRRVADLNRAFAILSDPRARLTYDRQCAAAAGSRGQPEPAHPVHALPPGQASGVVLDYGRYQGWSLGQLAQHEPKYLRWLAHTPSGRPFRADIEALLGEVAEPARASRLAR